MQASRAFLHRVPWKLYNQNAMLLAELPAGDLAADAEVGKR